MAIQRLSLGWAAVCLFIAAGCAAPPPDNDDLADASTDGFLDVPSPDGVDFDEQTNLSVRLVSEIDDADIAVVAAAQGVPQEWIDLLPLVSLIANIELTLNYADGVTNTFTQHVAVEQFELGFEFACPQSVGVALSVDAFSPFGEIEQLFVDSSAALTQDRDFACGDTLAYRAYVDPAGDIHFELVEDDSSAGAN